MLKNLLIQTAKSLSALSKSLSLGNGSTWPGHLALQINPHIVEDILKDSKTKIIVVVGTNGKTTTSTMLTTILKEEKKHVIQNTSGANLLNGIASTLLLHTNTSGKLTADYAIFEVDENNLPIVLQHLTPHVVVALNLFRDQLDRYGELDSIARKWNHALKTLPSTTTIVLNADDPLIAYLAKESTAHVAYFGMDEPEKGQKQLEHAADSVYCPQCGNRLTYKKIFYSHMGMWKCPSCHVKRPMPMRTTSFYPLPGMYNKYNTLAAVLAAQSLGIAEDVIIAGLQKVHPAFGRQEVLHVGDKKIQIFLSKNPTSMNESLRTIIQLSKPSTSSGNNSSLSEQSESKRLNKLPTVLLVLNDRIPDGRDVSWIWDIDLEQFLDNFNSLVISGDRCFDMALRAQYASDSPSSISHKLLIEEDLPKAIGKALKLTKPQDTLYILPTYSAMLEVRKILTGRKIL